MRKVLLAGMAMGLPFGIMAQTNRHNNLGPQEHLWKMKRIAAHEFIAVGNSGAVMKYNDSCNDWLPLPLNNNADFRNISFPNASTGFISGPSDAFYKTIDGGASWSAILPAATGLTNGSIQCVYFRDALTGFIAGSQIGVSGGGRFIKKTTDGGSTWANVTPSTIATSTVYDMAFFSNGTGLAVATNNKAFRTTDDGATWVAATTPGTAYSVAVAGTSTVAVAVANSNIMRSTDQGLTWTTIPTTATGLQGVHFYDALHGMITGAAGALLYTADGGLTWSAIPTLLSQKLYDVQMTAERKAVAVGADGTVLDVDLDQSFHRLFEEHFCHPIDSLSYTGYTNTDKSSATPPRKWFFTNVNEANNGLEAAQWFPGKFAIYDAYYYEDVLSQHHTDSAMIETRSLNLAGVSLLSLDWNEAFYTHPDGLSKTRVEGFNGTAWVTLYESTGMDAGDGVASAIFPTHKRAIDISTLAGVTNARLRFSYIAPNTNDGLKNFWAVSDIVISNRSTSVQLDTISAAGATGACLSMAPKDIKVTMSNTGAMPVFPLELRWSSSDGRSGAAADYNMLAPGTATTITLIDNFTPPAAGGAITLKAWISKLPNQVAANDTVSATFYFVPEASGTALLGVDTAICPGGTYTLQAPATLSNVLWSDGSHAATFSTGTAGTYWISGQYGACTVSDTIRISMQSVPVPVISLQGSVLRVDNVYARYQWFYNNTALPGTPSAQLTPTQNGNYFVVVTTAAGCSDTSAVFRYENQGTGIDTTAGNIQTLKVYPNPATDLVTLDPGIKLSGILTLTIADAQGRRLQQQAFNSSGPVQVNIAALPAGVYWLRLTGDRFSAYTRLVKK
ncbi:T9SS type A sorting domain-containing protein [Taibaiella koreensis]|uniref:T9SS type A sorting domain-containing protein n=1 Tax=Taibaiella koreensis TaxID=1268548 RepID=UPI000E59C040|nr:YCF48-related protein [Taibaiella koreensis]